ncbi:hypothetical protein D030_4294B, partial [Vibrio parahaemolyticus AQ3810]
KPSIGQVV